MSLISDALKKARQAQAQHPAQHAPPEFRAAESQPDSHAKPSMLIVILLAVAVSLGGFLLWLGLRGQRIAELAAPPPKPTTKSAIAEAAAPIPAAPPKATSFAAVQSSAAPTATVSTTTVPVVAETPKVVVAAATPPAEPLKPALPRLGGIFYNPTRPSAILNNKTVYVGSHVADFIVLAITAEKVTVAAAGQTNVLSLSD
jgi:cytoskeletal protein RodZ